jgi:hypothetical protein
MDALDITRLIVARCPELSADDVERIRVALTDETLPASALPVLMAVIERIEMRMVALETGTTHLLM